MHFFVTHWQQITIIVSFVGGAFFSHRWCYNSGWNARHNKSLKVIEAARLVCNCQDKNEKNHVSRQVTSKPSVSDYAIKNKTNTKPPTRSESSRRSGSDDNTTNVVLTAAVIYSMNDSCDSRNDHSSYSSGSDSSGSSSSSCGMD